MPEYDAGKSPEMGTLPSPAHQPGHRPGTVEGSRRQHLANGHLAIRDCGAGNAFHSRKPRQMTDSAHGVSAGKATLPRRRKVEGRLLCRLTFRIHANGESLEKKSRSRLPTRPPSRTAFGPPYRRNPGFPETEDISFPGPKTGKDLQREKFIFLPLTLNFLQRKKYLFPSEKRRPCKRICKNGMDLSIHRRLAPFPAGKEPLHAARTFLISHPPLPVGPLLFRSPAPSRCSFPCVSLN